jgi:hypothetical protein
MPRWRSPDDGRVAGAEQSGIFIRARMAVLPVCGARTWKPCLHVPDQSQQPQVGLFQTSRRTAAGAACADRGRRGEGRPRRSRRRSDFMPHTVILPTMPASGGRRSGSEVKSPSQTISPARPAHWAIYGSSCSMFERPASRGVLVELRCSPMRTVHHRTLRWAGGSRRCAIRSGRTALSSI